MIGNAKIGIVTNTKLHVMFVFSDRAIPSGNIDLHTAHCARNLEKCKVCGDMVPRKHAEEHYYNTHAPVSDLCQRFIFERDAFFFINAIAITCSLNAFLWYWLWLLTSEYYRLHTFNLPSMCFCREKSFFKQVN